MLEDVLGIFWGMLKRTWSKRHLRLHVVTWGITSFMAAGLYLYIGFRVSELRADAREGKEVRAVELKDLQRGIARVEDKVDQVYGYLLDGRPRSHRIPGEH